MRLVACLCVMYFQRVYAIIQNINGKVFVFNVVSVASVCYLIAAGYNRRASRVSETLSGVY